MTSSSALLETYAQLPFPLVRGEDVWVYDDKGRRYLDLYGGHAVALLGHCPARIVKALGDQAKEFFFYSNVAPIPARDRAVEKFAAILPQELRHIFFCNSGAEANENALKLSIRLTGREKLVALKGSFHGRSLLATAVTDAQVHHAELKGWVAEKVTFLEPNKIDALAAINETTAAVIVEPILSIAGVVELDLAYLKALRARCSETGSFLIFDEVQTGMGRAGLPFVSGFSGVMPDMATLAKGIAGGFPIGALLLHDSVAPRIKKDDLGSTFGGGPLAMAALGAAVETLLEEKLVENAKKIGEYARQVFRIKGVSQVKGQGCLLGIALEEDAKGVYQKLLDAGIITGTSKDPKVLRLLPPITVKTEHLDMLASALKEILVK